MPKQKDLKRLVRSRMQKTGESYTAARSHLVQKKTRTRNPVPSPAQCAELAGMSNDAVRNKTGRGWTEWVRALDAVDATGMPHRDIARHLESVHEIPGWWAQTVTVGYERIRGLREIGQRRGGAFEANKSRTFRVPIGTLYAAFATVRGRARWLGDVDVSVRTSTRNRSIRFNWEDGTPLQAYFVARGADRSQVSVQHQKLARKADIIRVKAFWDERFRALGESLAPRG